MEDIDFRPGYLYSVGIGAVAGLEHYLDSGMSFGLDFSIGYRSFWANGVDLGARGPDRDMLLHTGYAGLEGSVGYMGLRVFFAAQMGFNHYKTLDGLTDGDFIRPRYGVGNIGEEVNLMFSSGLKVSVPGFTR